MEMIVSQKNLFYLDYVVKSSWISGMFFLIKKLFDIEVTIIFFCKNLFRIFFFPFI